MADAQTEGKEPASLKIKGISYVSPPNALKKVEIDPLNDVSANYLAVMPFAHMPSPSHPGLRFEYSNQWWGEGPVGVRAMIDSLHQRNFKLMLKPQVWISGGIFTGHLQMNSNEDWEILEESYRKYILKYAKIAQDEKVSIFCIGTELGKWVAARPGFWNALIEEVRAVYKGRLTYAENWDCFDRVPFLYKLDYIGVDAYFPLSDEISPSKEQLIQGWLPHIARMKECSEKFDLPILLTEIGYRNVVGAADKPWDYSQKDAEIDEDIQALLYEVMFDLVYQQDFIAGGFIWKWFPLHGQLKTNSRGYSPQHKKAQAVLKHWYSKL